MLRPFPTFLLLFWVLMASSAFLRAENPSASDLLAQVYGEETQQPYRGEVISVLHYGAQLQKSRARLMAAPGKLYRKEFLDERGQLEKLIVCDGKNEKIYFPRRNRVWLGPARRDDAYLFDRDQGFELLEKNYDVRLLHEDTVAGQKTWLIEIVGKQPGKPKRWLWVSQAQNTLVLRNQEFSPEGILTVESRFEQITFPEAAAENSFTWAAPAGAHVSEHQMGLDFLSWEELQKRAKNLPTLPQNLPGGFLFAGGNVIHLRRQAVAQLTFSDGLAQVSLFVSSVPFSKQDGQRFARASKIARWKKGDNFYLLIANVSTAVLNDLRQALR